MKENKKLFTKIGCAIVGIAMAIGVGVAASRDGAREARAVTSISETAATNVTNGTKYVLRGEGSDYYLAAKAENTWGTAVALANAYVFTAEVTGDSPVTSNFALKCKDGYLSPKTGGSSNTFLEYNNSTKALQLINGELFTNANTRFNLRYNAGNGFRWYGTNSAVGTTGVAVKLYEVLDAEATITGLTIQSGEAKKWYSAGESFDPTGLVIYASWNGGEPDTENNVVEDVVWNNGAALTAGLNQTITGYHSSDTGKAHGVSVTGVNVYDPNITLNSSNSPYVNDAASLEATKVTLAGIEYETVGGYLNTYNDFTSLTFPNNNDYGNVAYLTNNTAFPNKIKRIAVTFTGANNYSNKLTMFEGDVASTENASVDCSKQANVSYYDFSGTTAHFKLKLTTGGSYVNIAKIDIYFGESNTKLTVSSVSASVAEAERYAGEGHKLTTSDFTQISVTWNDDSVTNPTKDYSWTVNGVLNGDLIEGNNAVVVTYGGVNSSAINVPAILVHAESISITESATIYTGESVDLEATVLPAGYVDTISWESSNEEVATVDENGKVVGVGEGGVMITATINGHSDTCSVEVLAGPGIKITKENVASTYADMTNNGFTVNGVHFAGADVGNNSNTTVQMKKTSGKMYNISDNPLGFRITKIRLSITSGSVTVYFGTSELSETPTGDDVLLSTVMDADHKVYTVTSGDYSYIRLVSGTDSAATMDDISIWYNTHAPEISVSPKAPSFEEGETGNVEVTITKQYLDGEVTYEATSSDPSVVTNESIQIENNKVIISKANVSVGNAIITVNAKVGGVVKASDTFTITCTAHNRQFVSYAITTQATKTTFDAGEKFSINGLVVTGTFDAAPTTQDITADCTYKLVPAEGPETTLVPGETVLSAGGDFSVKIVYSNNETLVYSIKVLTLASIAVLTNPTKTTYRIGQTIDLTGMVLEGTKSDGSKITISEGFTSSTLDSTTAGQKSVTITYNGLTTTLQVTVIGDVYYSKIASASDLKAGDKILIVAQDKDATKLSAATTTGTNKYLEAKDITLSSDGKILQTDEIQACEFTLSGQSGAWKLTNSQGKELAVTSTSSANLMLVDPGSELAHTWDITYDSAKGTFTLTAPKGGSLQYNSSNPRFTNYTSAQVNPMLYKVGAAAPVDPTEPTVTKIEIESMPTKTQYNIGDEFNSAGLSIKVTYSDTTTAVVTTGFTCTGFDSTAAGEKTITVTYEGKTVTFKVTVAENPQPQTKTLSSISVRNAQETYDYGQEIDKSKLTVIATYSDNSTATVTNYTLSGYNKEQAGQQTVTVSYTEGGVTKTATFTVTVNAQPTDPIEAARLAAINELRSYVANLGESNYSAENWTKIQDYLAEAPEILAGLDTQEKIDRYVAAFKNYITTIPTSAEDAARQLADAKAEALSALAEYYNSIDQTQYDDAGRAALVAALNDGNDAIEAATSIEGVATALQNAKAALDAVAKKPAAPARRCGGDIAATSIILSAIALVGAGLLVFKKRKED